MPQSQLWINVVTRTEQRGATLCVTEQRIVISTLAYIVHDLMADKVQEYNKTHSMLEATSCSAEENPDTSSCVFSESNVSLYRYGAIALHSMIRKWLAHKTKITVKNELDLLEHLKVTKEQWGQLPAAILELNKGDLVVSHQPCCHLYVKWWKRLLHV